MRDPVLGVGLRSSMMWPFQDKAHIHLLGECCRSQLWLSKLKTNESLSTVQFTLVLWTCTGVSWWTWPLLQPPLPQQDSLQGIKDQYFLLKALPLPPSILTLISKPMCFRVHSSLFFFHIKKSPVSVQLRKTKSLSDPVPFDPLP